MQIKPMYLLLLVWGGIILLGWYQQQNPTLTMQIVYSIAFFGAFGLSVLHIYRRNKERGRKE